MSRVIKVLDVEKEVLVYNNWYRMYMYMQSINDGCSLQQAHVHVRTCMQKKCTYTYTIQFKSPQLQVNYHTSEVLWVWLVNGAVASRGIMERMDMPSERGVVPVILLGVSTSVLAMYAWVRDSVMQ